MEYDLFEKEITGASKDQPHSSRTGNSGNGAAKPVRDAWEGRKKRAEEQLNRWTRTDCAWYRAQTEGGSIEDYLAIPWSDRGRFNGDGLGSENWGETLNGTIVDHWTYEREDGTPQRRVNVTDGDPKQYPQQK